MGSRGRWLTVLALPLLLLVLAGCRPAPETEAVVAQAPWQDGEQQTLDVIRDSQWADEVRFEVSKHPDGWLVRYVRGAGQQEGEVVLGPDLSPLRADHRRGTDRWMASYGDEEITVESRTQGTSATKSVPRPADVVDLEVAELLPRGLPLAEGYQRHLTLFDAHNLLTYDATLWVVGSETFEGAIGRAETWHVALDWGPLGQRQLWYSKETPHWCVRQHSSTPATETLLRSYRAGASAPLRGLAARPASAPRSTPLAVATPPAPPRNWGFVASSLLVQYPLMILLPFALVVVLRRKLGVPPSVAGIGALSFVSSQVVHLPLNYALGLSGAGGIVTQLPLWGIGVAAGLSAGLCEECARYAFMRWALKRHQGWASSIQFGAGHGGIESVLLGLLAATSLFNFLVLPLFGEATFTPELQAAARDYWHHGWDTPIYAGMERVAAISAHIGMSVLVMRAVTRRNLGYLGAAILLHTALDAPLVFLPSLKPHPLLVELGLLVVGLAFLGLGLWLREPRPLSRST